MEVHEEMILKYNQPGPRYTSYPPAVHFHTAYKSDQYLHDVEASNHWSPANLSFYFHVPFCPRLCHFCGCNTQITRDEDFISRYMRAMLKEMDLVLSLTDPSRPVTQVHWGGGTPNAISLDHIGNIMSVLRKRFRFAEEAEVAMECNPAYLEPGHIDQLSEMGFNRLSLGVQDLDPEVLRTVNRLPSKYPLEELIGRMRSRGFKGVNIDLIYGLPGQSPESFFRTVEKVAALRPDRLVTFSYAHVPWVKAAQKILEETGIPGPELKLKLFRQSLQQLKQARYVTVGMDHYALPHDPLARARHAGTLHRNFQGYCTRDTTGQVLAFGASSISQLEYVYSQNVKEAGEYVNLVEQNGLAVERGYRLNRAEHAVRESINQLMCNGKLLFSEMAARLGMPVGALKKTLQYDPGRFEGMMQDGLLEAGEDGMDVSPQGMALVRVMAMQLDPLTGQQKNQFSKVI